MALAPGTRLGPYEVLAPLGAGGMGEVYRARDPRLGREVAIKLLPAERLSDPARRARFVREARTASALNHPSIVTVYEIESAEGVDFIVMELARGETLARLLRRGALSTGEVLRLSIPVADALATAHAAGIIHRDLKPANVMVTPQGGVKVLDFGLAKLVHDDSMTSDVSTAAVEDGPAALSQAGVVMGTAGYLSPEQASGGSVDARSDIFSFGVLLYEMVTGRRAFAGDSKAQSIAAVLRDQPRPPSEIVTGVPRDLERIILRCLRKEPERRFQSMADVKVELLEVKENSDSQATVKAGAGIAARRTLRVIALLAAGSLVLAAFATLWGLRQRENPAARVVLLASSRRTDCGTFSPDGSQIAFGSPGERGTNWGIWLKMVGEAETRRLTTDPADSYCPAWSPDGRQIAFVRLGRGASSGAVHLVSPLGGPERRMSDLPVNQDQLSWSPDARWLAASRARAQDEATPETGGIYLIPTGGGDPRALTLPKPPAWDASPAFSPDGRALAYISCEYEGGFHLCDLHVLALDPELRPKGTPRDLTPRRPWVGGVAWVRDGRSIIYGDFGDRHLWRVRADGSTPPERVELAGRGAFAPFTVTSREGLGFIRDSSDVDIYRFQLGTAAVTPLLASSAWEVQPQYSPDGWRIAFESAREGENDAVWLADADGSNPTRLTRGPGRGQGSPRWSPDGRTVAFDAQAEDGHYDVWTVGVDGSGLHQVTHRATDHGPASWSRDGRWIYFTSSRTGRPEVFRMAAAGGSDEQVTREGGCIPFESPDGRTLYYKRTETADGPLLARPTAGVEERTVIGCIPALWSYSADPKGVFHLDCKTTGIQNSLRALRHWDATTGQDRLLAVLDTGPIEPVGLSSSPDGQSVLFTHSTSAFDLMMIENFR